MARSPWYRIRRLCRVGPGARLQDHVPRSRSRQTVILPSVTRRLELDISESVWQELNRRQAETDGDLSHIVDSALATAFDLERHSLFQVSTSNALVRGVFAGAITVGELKSHGDFGLGTFTGLDGELIMVEGHCYRAGFGGQVGAVDDAREVPFALVTRFTADLEETISDVSSIHALTTEIDRLLPSQNLFAGIRIDGVFGSLMMRAACPARHGEGLLEATRHQSEFQADEIEGTVVGFWAPEYSRAVSVPGYHFHFLSADRGLGGHVLDMRSGPLTVQLQTESDVHLAMPETAEFLAADLSGEHREALETAETSSRKA
jgi:acetolactate decarboxylase